MILSFIIPAYNAMSTIKRCLDSIYSLPLNETEFEVIVVDDCSTDNTLALLKEYADKKNNMLVLHQEFNQRQGAARNLALTKARGQYITYIDADDYVENGLVEALNVANGTDIIVCRAYVQEVNGTMRVSKLSNEPTQVVSGKVFMNDYHDWHFIGAPWGYLFRTDFLREVDIPYAENVVTEDEDFINIHLYLAKSVFCSPTIICTNTYNTSGTTKSKRTLFMDASRILCSYREFIYTEKYCKDDETHYNWFREIATHHVEATIKRLWKTKVFNYWPFYNYVNEDIRLYLLKIQSWSKKTYFALKYPKTACLILTVLSPILRTLKLLR